MTIRCKFRLDERMENVETYMLKFRAVTSGSDENKAFFKWTPNGELTFHTVNKEAAAGLAIGREYYLDIVEAE